jgi:AcrR family transcriptional regulator
MPKIVDHDRYRKELLSQSFDLFAEKGYATVTMRQIAQALGVSTGTLYHYFPSKEVLFEQLLEELTRLDILSISEQLQEEETLLGRIRGSFKLLEMHRDYFLKQALLIADFRQQQRRDGQESQVFQRIYDQVENLIPELFGINDPTLTKFLMIYVDGLIWQDVYGCNCVDRKSQEELICEIVMMYLEKHGLHQE